MPLDIYADRGRLVVEAALPGVKPEDVEISVLGDTPDPHGARSGEERRATRTATMYREVRRGRFSRTVTLPSGLRTDEATATFENGMLRLSSPRPSRPSRARSPVATTTEGTAMPAWIRARRRSSRRRP